MRAQVQRIVDYLSSFYRPEEWPALLAQTMEWDETRPLEGLKVLDATPLYRNTLGKLAALMAAGADVYVPTNNSMPYSPEIHTIAPQFGIKFATRKDNPFDIVLDCAGQFTRLHPTLGFCELTRTGVSRYEHTLHHPIFVADCGKIKRLETMLGTGEGFFRALAQLGYDHVEGRRLLVVGLGKVGRGVVHYARRFGMTVIVADEIDKRGELPHDIDFVNVNDIDLFNEAVLSSWCTVTATGKISALRHKLHAGAIIESPVLLANLGVNDEFGSAIPESRVLNRKRPLNFLLDEPTSMRFIETTMALHNACGLELLTADLPHKCLPPSPDVEERLLRIATAKGLIGRDIESMKADPLCHAGY